MSIRRVIFTFGQNVKAPFLGQYLIFLEISFGSLLYPKNRNLMKIADLKVLGNLRFGKERGL